MGQIPDAVRKLQERGLEIRACDDLRSFKKLVPCLEAFPQAFVVTADDDLYYSRRWLETLVSATDSSERLIVCHRAHRPKLLGDGQLAPYLDWELDVQDGRARVPSPDVMPTSGAGALYPPQCLDPCVTGRALFQRLCPNGDDLWFYWCARMAGAMMKKVSRRMRLITWDGSQQESLWEENKRGRNDEMIRALVDEFGVDVLGLPKTGD